MDDFSGWLFIDLMDLHVVNDLHLTSDGKPVSIEDWRNEFPGCLIKGNRQKLKGEWSSITHLSVVYSSVTKTILDRCPKLRWVIARGHGYHNIDVAECRRRGIGVSTLGGYRFSCAEFLLNHIKDSPVVFYGYGRIPKVAESRLPRDFVVSYIRSKTDKYDVARVLGEAKTIAASVPVQWNKAPVFTREVFFNCRGAKFISVCHKELIRNEDLRLAILNGNISEAVVDEIYPEGSEDLLETGKVLWTKNTACSTGFDQQIYKRRQKESIMKTLSGEFEGIVVHPGEKCRKDGDNGGFFV